MTLLNSSPQTAVSLRFCLTQALVDRFAALTGDRSALHVDAAFARRSPYRRRVVHGMLPVMYLARLYPAFEASEPHYMAALTAQFVKPSFVGMPLELVCKPRSSASDNAETAGALEYEYQLIERGTGEPLTSGSVVFKPGAADEPAACRSDASADPSNESSSLVVGELQERIALFEDVTKGEEATLALNLSSRHVKGLADILLEGLDGDQAQEHDRLPDPAFLLAACSSTYVGMRMPGRYATYTDFTSNWNRPVSLDEEVVFKGAVRFLSPSTRFVVSAITLETPSSNEPIAQGKVKVRVSQPPASMPSMAEVNQRSMTLGLEDRVVLVTGASRGIGETVAKLFAAQGARVAINYFRGSSDASRIAREIEAAGGHAMAVQADVTSRDEVSAMVEQVAARLGGVEVLVNNAAGDYASKHFEHLQWSDVQKDLDIIVKGAFQCCQAVLPSMIDQRYGRIVNVSTLALENPPEGHAAYTMAKSALLGLTRSLAVEYASFGVCVNAVMPGMVQTDLTSNISSMVKESVRQSIPMKRHASPLDVARAVVYLASEWAAYTTGQQLPVTGGLPPFF